MSRQDANARFALTSFLYGGNAHYIDDLYARYEIDPNGVDAEWQAFFAGMKDQANGAKVAQGPSWKKPNWPETSRGEMDSQRDRLRARDIEHVVMELTAQIFVVQQRIVMICRPQRAERAIAGFRALRFE